MPTDRLAPAAPTPAIDRPSAPRGGRPTGDVDAFAALLGAATERPERPAAERRPAEPGKGPGPQRHRGAGGHEPRGLRPDAPDPATAPTGEAPRDTPETGAIAPQADAAPATPAAPVADAVLASLVGPVPLPDAAPVVPAGAEAPAAAPAVPVPAPAAGDAEAAPSRPVAVPAGAPADPSSAGPEADGRPVAPAAPAAATDAGAAPVDADGVPILPVTPPPAPSGAPAEAPQRATVTLPLGPTAAAPPIDPSAVPAAPTTDGPAAPAVAAETATPRVAPAGDDAPAPASAAPQSPVPGLSGPDAPATPAPAPVVLPHRTESLHRAPQAVATLLHVAADRGITRARLALRPAELGGVEVQLSSTAAGITARLVADSPEAARMLAHAGEELRRSLEDRNVTLISLEVATSGEERREAAPGGRRGEHADERAASGRDTDGDAAPGDAEAASDPVHSVLELPGGLLVDVLA